MWKVLVFALCCTKASAAVWGIEFSCYKGHAQVTSKNSEIASVNVTYVVMTKGLEESVWLAVTNDEIGETFKVAVSFSWEDVTDDESYKLFELEDGWPTGRGSYAYDEVRDRISLTYDIPGYVTWTHSYTDAGYRDHALSASVMTLGDHDITWRADGLKKVACTYI